MRRNYELFGSYISLNMTKRGINNPLWPYTSVTIYDEMMNLCLACEGIVCGEILDMYQFISSFLVDHSPGRRLPDVDIVSSNGFFNI